MYVIRDELPSDLAAVRDVNRRAFGQDDESVLVDRLRANGAVQLSLVATAGDAVVGHILYTPVRVGEVTGAALAPMAVRPDHQGRGVGSRLVAEGTRRLQAAGCPFILVLGHPGYYPRFGFSPARPHGITCPWEVPDEVFLVRILDAPRMAGVSGRAAYRPEFSPPHEPA